MVFMKLSSLNLNKGDRLKVGFCERDGIYYLSWNNDSVSLKKDFEVVYYKQGSCVLLIDDYKIHAGIIDIGSVNSDQLQDYFGMRGLFLYEANDYAYLELINNQSGAFCKKCNRFNEYIDSKEYVCYECR